MSAGCSGPAPLADLEGCDVGHMAGVECLQAKIKGPHLRTYFIGVSFAAVGG